MKYAVAAFLMITNVVSITTAQARGPQQMSAQLKTAAGTLHGTLEIPPGEGPFPVALIVPGSGAIDRNGNDTELGLHTNCYKPLAAALAHNGIAPLCYGKHGVVASAQSSQSESKLRLTDYVHDAAAWGRLLRAERRFRDKGANHAH